jgi:hypothetical protein
MIITIIAIISAIWIFGSIAAFVCLLFSGFPSNEEYIAALFWPIVLLALICFWIYDISGRAAERSGLND